MLDRTVLAEMRDRAMRYPLGSPENDAFIAAIVRLDHAEDDARTDAAIMRSWKARGAV